MSKQVSPFAALTGAERQIRWLEYQSVKLPYVDVEPVKQEVKTTVSNSATEKSYQMNAQNDRPQPPPEVPRMVTPEMQKTRHSQYDAVIARLKQAELQARVYASQSAQQLK